MEFYRETWRPIYNFPNYAMNQDGDIKNVRTGLIVNLTMQDGRSYVQLFRNGRRYKRSWRRLVETTYPVRREDEVFLDWVVIPGFEDYEISNEGAVRRVSTGREIAVRYDSGEYVQLSRDGKSVKKSISGLMRLVGKPYKRRQIGAE